MILKPFTKKCPLILKSSCFWCTFIDWDSDWLHLFDAPFLTQTKGSFTFPIIGEKDLTTVTIFEAGVALTVIGTLVTIILSISEDE